jgi:hypothetical protein
MTDSQSVSEITLAGSDDAVSIADNNVAMAKVPLLMPMMTGRGPLPSDVVLVITSVRDTTRRHYIRIRVCFPAMPVARSSSRCPAAS